jgi:hypothetical protein
MILFLNRNDEKWPHTRQIKIAGRNHILPPLRIAWKTKHRQSGVDLLGGGCTEVRNPVGFGQQGCKGGAKKLNSEIWHNFQGFSFFEVKLKLIIQCPYRRK